MPHGPRVHKKWTQVHDWEEAHRTIGGLPWHAWMVTDVYTGYDKQTDRWPKKSPQPTAVCSGCELRQRQDQNSVLDPAIVVSRINVAN